MQYRPGLLFDDRYLFKRFLGSGSFGEVWLAQDNETDLDVAVKIYISVDAQGLSDFRKEFQLSFNLHHTNLLHANYLGVSKNDNKPYLVMPFCQEGSVTKLAGKMTENELWHFLRDVAMGLDYLHSQKPPIIHQDIKPDNILILKKDNYVISDFGISKQLKSTLKKSSNFNSASGAVAYMGPERFSKQYQAVKASDIWSLGVTIYELVYGDMPFCGLGGSMQKQGADIPDLPEDFSQEMKSLFQSCLAAEPWYRPSAKQIADYTDDYINGRKPEITWNCPTEDRNIVQPAQPAQTQHSGQPSFSTVSNSDNVMEGDPLERGKAQLQPRGSIEKTVVIANGTQNNETKTLKWWWFIVMAVLGTVSGAVAKYILMTF